MVTIFQRLFHKITMEFWLEWDIMSSYFTSMIGECVLPLQQHNSLIIQPKGMVVRNIYHICQEQMGVSQEHPAEQHHFYYNSAVAPRIPDRMDRVLLNNMSSATTRF